MVYSLFFGYIPCYIPGGMKDPYNMLYSRICYTTCYIAGPHPPLCLNVHLVGCYCLRSSTAGYQWRQGPGRRRPAEAGPVTVTMGLAAWVAAASRVQISCLELLG